MYFLVYTYIESVCIWGLLSAGYLFECTILFVNLVNIVCIYIKGNSIVKIPTGHMILLLLYPSINLQYQNIFTSCRAP